MGREKPVGNKSCKRIMEMRPLRVKPRPPARSRGVGWEDAHAERGGEAADRPGRCPRDPVRTRHAASGDGQVCDLLSGLGVEA